MSKVALTLMGIVLSAGMISAQTSSASDDRAGRWVKGHWSRHGHHRAWIPGHWTTSEQAREEYKEIEVADETPPAVGKFVDDTWTLIDGRIVYVRKHFARVAAQDANFSAASLNSRQVEVEE